MRPQLHSGKINDGFSPVIGSEEDKSVIVNISIFQCLKDLPHPPVKLIQGIPKCQSDAGVGELLAGKLRVVGVLEGHVQEEWS